uniref:E3 ubiquitin-protein ligase TRIM13-like n=1 Tax=Myxine glutinosa TaxID=7769 RepID=UPI00358F052A
MEGLEDDLTCPVCFSVLADPRSLPCAHTFCSRCLDALLLRAAPRRKGLLSRGFGSRCPTCQRTFQAARASDLPVNYALSAVLETFSRQRADAETCKEHTGQPQTLHCLQCHGPICLRCIAPIGRHAGHQFDTPAGARERERLGLVNLAEALRNGPRWKAVEPRRARMNAENSLVTRTLDEVEQQVAAEFRALCRELEALGEEIAAVYTHMHTEVTAACSADTAELNSLLIQRERMLRRYEDFQSQPDTSAYLRSVGTMRAEMESLARTALPPVVVAQIPAAAHAQRLSHWAARARSLISEAPIPPRYFTRRKVLGPYPSQSHLGRLQLVAQALAYTSVASTLAVIVLALAGRNYATVWWISLFIASGAALGLTSLWSWTQGSLRSSGCQASLLSFCLEGPSILPEITGRSVWLARAVIMKIRQETDTALGWFKHLCESWGSYR